MTVVLLVSHTHWDREWYHSAARFRQRLVALVDELVEKPPRPPADPHFLLDGQTSVVEDYLAVRPDREAALASLLTSGAVEAGPWFVLADELIPGGEALVRNLLTGRRTLRRLGALESSPRVLYCPDSFGHPAMLPALARGFGFATIIVWRGFGGARRPLTDCSWWEAPSGDRALLYHLSRSGYELGANMPADPAAATVRWSAIREELLSRNRTGVALLLNGADHHARQRTLAEAVRSLQGVALPDTVTPSSLGAFTVELDRRASAVSDLPIVKGELCDSYGFTWTLQGTLATRAHQKRRSARLERLLVRDTEPWAALAARAVPDGGSRRMLMDAAWRSLLLCHPHDTLCGCSTDEVARAMDARLDEAGAQGAGIRDDSLRELIGHHADDARERRAEWAPMVVVRNAVPRPRGGVALVRLTKFLADVPVGPGSASRDLRIPARAGRTPAVGDFAAVQVLSRAAAHERTEAPRHYPDDDLVFVSEVAAWVPEVPGYGVRCFPHTPRNRAGVVPNQARVEGDVITNGRISIRVHGDGRVEFTDLSSGRSIPDLLRWESLHDRGDAYTPSVRGEKFAPVFNGVRVLHRGPVRAAFEMRWRLGAGRVGVAVTVRLIVDADARWLRIAVDGVNGAADHRLRLRVATDVPDARVLADAMFGPAERVAIEVWAQDRVMETPPATAPLHRYVSLFGYARGATVYSDGLAEYEMDDGGGVLVTLLRSVGELSRADLPERPGHAGWPTPIPEAQCKGPFAGEFALLLHGGASAATTDEIERAADDILLPLSGGTLRSALHIPGVVSGFELEGEGLAFSCAKESEDGRWLVLRCVNPLDVERAGTWTLREPVAEARLARLDETPLGAVEYSGRRVAFRAAPREVVTVLVR